ncbi:hypothetical protein KIPB_006573, partial [Kipferlia bialata]|eukprot:g6573.t1
MDNKPETASPVAEAPIAPKEVAEPITTGYGGYSTGSAVVVQGTEAQSSYRQRHMWSLEEDAVLTKLVQQHIEQHNRPNWEE